MVHHTKQYLERHAKAKKHPDAPAPPAPALKAPSAIVDQHDEVEALKKEVARLRSVLRYHVGRDDL